MSAIAPTYRDRARRWLPAIRAALHGGRDAATAHQHTHAIETLGRTTERTAQR